MMDVIINLIIFLIVVITILKRLQEVARKGTEIKEPSPEPQPLPIDGPVAREIIAEMPEEYPQPAAPAPVPVEEKPRTQSMRELFERLERRYYDIIEPPVPQTEDTFESGREKKDISRRGYAKQAAIDRAAPSVESAALPALSFKASSVVNGIIMSEILGPPTGLRKSPFAHSGW